MKSSFRPVLAVSHLSNCDSRMAYLIDQIGRCKLQVNDDLSLFQTLLRAIVYQKIATHSAAAIYQRVQALFPRPLDIQPNELLSLDSQFLLAAGLSRAKAAAVVHLAEKTADGTVPDLDDAVLLSDEELVEQITKVRGVGRWTVEMLLIYRLGRPDVLPVGDFAVRKGYQLAYNIRTEPTPSALAKAGIKWAPYRSVASWYLWRATDSVDWTKRVRGELKK